MIRISRRLGALLIIVLIVVSCSRQPEEYAVLLWPDTGSSLEAGTVAGITETGPDETVTVIQNDEEISLERWRIRSFEEQTAAESYAETFAPWKETYARSMRTALPVRARPDSSSERLYRLRDGELMKVLNRQDERADEGGLSDYWYEILTREGVIGWVFGYHLELTGAAGRALDPREEHDGLDRLVRDIASVVWRPEYFERMVSAGRINLDEFAPRFGLFGDWEENEFRIVLPDVQREVSYTGYRSSDGRIIEFEGADLEMEYHGEERLTVTYSVNGRRRSTEFRIFDEDISLVIEAELERRERKLQEFLDRGSQLISTAYGTMTIFDDRRVTWTDYDRLVPNVIPPAFDGSGRIRFDLFLSDSLHGRYDGVLKLTGSTTEIAFLYSFTDDGVRFVYVPRNTLDENGVILSEPVSPVVIFFRFFNG